MQHNTFLLPFIEEGKDRQKTFTKHMETAAILCIAEAKRRKKPSVLGAQPERTDYASKLYYPFWAIPLHGDALVIDGLGVINSKIEYSLPPETDVFLSQLEKAAELRELHMILLRSRKNTFKEFTAEHDIPMLGLVTDTELSTSLAEHAKKGGEASTAAADDRPTALIAPRLDLKTAQAVADTLNRYISLTAEEISRLEKTLSQLREDSQQRDEKIQGEIDELQKHYEAKLAALTAEVEKNVAALMSEKEIAVQRVAKLREEELKPVISLKQKSETKLKLLENEKENLKKRAANRKTGDLISVFSLENRIEENRNRIREEEGKIDAYKRFTELFQKETDELTSKLSADYDRKIGEEKDRITRLEAARDSEVSTRQSELEELRSLTTTITGMLERLITRKQVEEANLKKLAVPLEAEAPTLLYVPFYLVRLETDKEARYFAKAPSIAVGHGGVFRKIQKAVRRFSLESRVNHLLQSRSKPLQKHIESALVDALGEDKSLERNLNRLAGNSNLLRKADFKESLTKGLNELRDEGWIKQEEKDAVSAAYSP